MNTLKGKKILLGICGSIAAYKACELIRLLVKSQAEVIVVLTKNAENFVTPLTLKTLSKNTVITDLFAEMEFYHVKHVDVAQWADAIVIAPATANIIGKVANGIADDALSTAIMASSAPILFAPAMNDQMYKNKIYQENVIKLEKCGYYFIESETGPLACGYEGIGRLAQLDKIVKEIIKMTNQKNKGHGKKTS